jgi:hypothetical protein
MAPSRARSNAISKVGELQALGKGMYTPPPLVAPKTPMSVSDNTGLAKISFADLVAATSGTQSVDEAVLVAQLTKTVAATSISQSVSDATLDKPQVTNPVPVVDTPLTQSVADHILAKPQVTLPVAAPVQFQPINATPIDYGKFIPAKFQVSLPVATPTPVHFQPINATPIDFGKFILSDEWKDYFTHKQVSMPVVEQVQDMEWVSSDTQGDIVEYRDQDQVMGDEERDVDGDFIMKESLPEVSTFRCSFVSN